QYLRAVGAICERDGLVTQATRGRDVEDPSIGNCRGHGLQFDDAFRTGRGRVDRVDQPRQPAHGAVELRQKPDESQEPTETEVTCRHSPGAKSDDDQDTTEFE